MNRLVGTDLDGKALLEPGLAALAGFLAGLALRGNLPLLDWVIALFSGH